MHDIRFPTQIDTWLITAVAAVFALEIYFAVSVYPVSRTESIRHLAFIGFLAALSRLVAYPCDYRLTATHLIIRFGVFRRQIPYGEITAMEPSGNLWVAPALSLRRVKISFSGQFQLVSPREKERFILTLRERVAQAHETNMQHPHPVSSVRSLDQP